MIKKALQLSYFSEISTYLNQFFLIPVNIYLLKVNNRITKKGAKYVQSY